MKTSFAVVAVVALGLAGNAAAKGGGGNTSSNSAPAPHHGSSSSPAATTVAPRFSGGSMPHYSGGPRNSGAMPYRPSVNYRNGTRTLNYPPVGNSVLSNRVHSNAKGLNSGYALQRTGNLHKTDGLRQAGGLRQRGNLHGAGNSHQPSGLNAVGKNRLDPQTSNRLRNWSGNRDSTNQARLNHANNCHHHHGSNWWRNRCAAIIFFNWGWWGWYDGWWYPAWGYDPYSYYEYNEPIYGYDGLSPDQVVASVQAQLQQLGYYTYAIDGTMGPLTRAAIARYQRDHLLPITSGIDPATLGSLGIVR
jgi:putative peptidoglycan binding protein